MNLSGFIRLEIHEKTDGFFQNVKGELLTKKQI